MRADESGSISLILAVRNGANYLHEAIESALRQSRPPDEIIVVDDGSTDDTWKIARSFGRVIYARQEPSGVAVAQNLGIASTAGDFICFLDHDDLLPMDSIAVRLAALSSRPEAWYVYGAVEQFFSADFRPAQISRPSAALPTLTGRLLGASLFRREAFARAGTFVPGLRMGHMIEWVSRAEAAGIAGSPISDVVLRRRVHATNSVHDTQTLEANYLQALRMALRHKQAARCSDDRAT